MPVLKGALPGNQDLAQSQSIVRYLASITGLEGKDKMERAQVDMQDMASSLRHREARLAAEYAGKEALVLELVRPKKSLGVHSLDIVTLRANAARGGPAGGRGGARPPSPFRIQYKPLGNEINLAPANMRRPRGRTPYGTYGMLVILNCPDRNQYYRNSEARWTPPPRPPRRRGAGSFPVARKNVSTSVWS